MKQDALKGRIASLHMKQEGHYWMRCSPVGDWQIVMLRKAVGETPGTKELRVMFVGLPQRPSVAEFCEEHPDAQWGERVPGDHLPAFGAFVSKKGPETIAGMRQVVLETLATTGSFVTPHTAHAMSAAIVQNLCQTFSERSDAKAQRI